MASKRASVQANDLAKRVKTDPMVDGVMEAIDNADGLNDSCKTMLKLACPLAFSVPSDERNEIQHDVVEMIGEIIKNSQTSLQTSIDHELAKVAAANEQQDKLIQALKMHEEELRIATSRVETLQREMDAAIADTKSAEASLAEGTQLQASGDKQYELLKSERLRLQAMISRFIKRENVDCDVNLDLFAKSLNLDESLTIALPKACAKELDVRTAFDSMVVDEFQTILDSQIADLSKQIDDETPHVESRARVVEENSQIVSTKTRLQQLKSAEHAAAVNTQKKCDTAVQSSQEAILHGEISGEKATKACEFVKARLDKFQEWPLQCFEVLRDRPSKANIAGA